MTGAERGDPTLGRLEDQIRWYDRKSEASQRRFKVLKAVQILAAATIPVVATLTRRSRRHSAGPVVLIEGFLQLGQYQQNWIAYRSTCEALKHEKYLFLAAAGPYAARRTADRCSPTGSRA